MRPVCRAPRRIEAGWTLVEALVGITVLAVVLSVAAPGYGTYLANARVRAAADAVASGMSAAQAEAMRRSTVIEFLVTSAAPMAANGDAPAVASARNWMVRAPADATRGLTSAIFLRGSEDTAAAGAPTLENRAGALAIAFTPTGRVMSSAAGVLAAIAAPMVVRVSATGADRPLCVYATTTGAVKTCDPKLAAGDFRACQPAITAAACP